MTDEKHTGLSFAGVDFTEDGSAVTFRFTGPNNVATMTLPKGELAHVHTALGGVIDALIMAGVLDKRAGEVMRVTQSWKVGGSQLAPNHVAVMFDEGLLNEAVVLLPFLPALQVADAMQTQVFSGMSVDDQRAILNEVEKAAGKTPRLILPGTH